MTGGTDGTRSSAVEAELVRSVMVFWIISDIVSTTFVGINILHGARVGVTVEKLVVFMKKLAA
jgi:hypothetical protein